MPPPALGGRHFAAAPGGASSRHGRSGEMAAAGISAARQMPGLIKHRGVRIVTLEAGDTVADHARPGDIMIEQKDNGWYLHFIADDGSVESYEDPYDSPTKALWSAKAAAEFQASGE